MTKRLSAEEKAVIRDRQLAHWSRCEMWSKLLGTNKLKINRHWSCCIKLQLEDAQLLVPPADDIIARTRASFGNCLDRHRRYTVESDDVRMRSTCDDKGAHPDLEKHLHIMLWAIRTAGSRRAAKDAFDRAYRATSGR